MTDPDHKFKRNEELIWEGPGAKQPVRVQYVRKSPGGFERPYYRTVRVSGTDREFIVDLRDLRNP